MIKMLDEEKFCLNCRFWKTQNETSNWGTCHRYPPNIIFDVNRELNTEFFPETNGGTWCGEHQPHEKHLYPEDLISKGFVLVDPGL